MRYETLGNTGLRVSKLTVGTVELGTTYGIPTPGGSGPPGESRAAALLRSAAASGVNLFDTAPAYGRSEALLGRALPADCGAFIATKVPLAGNGASPAATASDIESSLRQSRRLLKREVLDIVQLHNATADTFSRGAAVDVLVKEKKAGRIRFIGASVYGEEAALAAIDSGRIDVLQVACSILDQRPAARVLPAARRAGIGIMARSVLLKGALTEKARHLPRRLSPLKEAVDRIRRELGVSWVKLPQIAVRFCLGMAGIHTLLIGVGSAAELSAALEAESTGPLPESEMARMADLAIDDERLLNPSHWEIP